MEGSVDVYRQGEREVVCTKDRTRHKSTVLRVMDGDVIKIFVGGKMDKTY